MEKEVKEKIESHAKIIADTIKGCFHKACPVPRELNQQELYNVIYEVGKICFIQGYSIGLNENMEQKIQ